METESISIIIPTFNRKKTLELLLDQLIIQIDNCTLNVYLIVVVDGSNDGTIEMIKSKTTSIISVLGDGSWWFTKCLNEGCLKAKELKSKFIITLNDDCSVPENFIIQMYNTIKTLPQKSALGAITIIKSNPYRVTFSGTSKFNQFRMKFHNYIDNRNEIAFNKLEGIYPSCSLMTRGMIVTMEDAEKIFFFDSINFPQYGSDEDFALRLRYSGVNLFVSWDIKIIDNPLLTSIGSSITKPNFARLFKSFFNKYSINSISKTIRFQWKHGHKLLLPINLIVFLLGTIYATQLKYKNTSINK